MSAAGRHESTAVEGVQLLAPSTHAPLELELGNDTVIVAVDSRSRAVVNLQALEGLRGIAACWIMIFHCFVYSTWPVDFQGSSLMPLFFMLTGLTHGAVTQYNSIWAGGSSAPTFWSFYNNRLARVVPMYYLMNLVFALPLWVVGYGDSPISDSGGAIGTTLTFSSTLFFFFLGGALDGPAWTVQSFLWLWLTFPWTMRWARGLSSEDLGQWLVHLYNIQLGVLLILFFSLVGVVGFWPAFCAATMHPVSRWPLFAMGVVAGELLHRTTVDHPQRLPNLGSVWPRSWCGHPCRKNGCCGGASGGCRCSQCCSGAGAGAPPPLQVISDPQASRAEQQEYWTAKAYSVAGGLTGTTLFISFVDRLARSPVDGSGGILGAVWFQALVPFAQLELIVALTQMNPDTALYRALTTPLALFLGEISMSVYLTHFPVIWLVCLGNNNFAAREWPTTTPTADDPLWVAWYVQKLLPLWGIPLVVAITIPLATAVHLGFAEPLRKWLKT